MTRRSTCPCGPGRSQRGFTLIEMLVVLAIVGVLAGAAVPLHELIQRRQQEQALREALRSIRSALDAHRQAVLDRRIAPGPSGSPWPADLTRLVRGVPLLGDDAQPRADGARLYLLRRLPRDPFADPALDAAASWALRASDTPPDAPAAGDDVFDISSRSRARALDGSFYHEW